MAAGKVLAWASAMAVHIAVATDPDTKYDSEAQAGNIPLYLFMVAYLGMIAGVGIVASKWKEEAKGKGDIEAQFSGDFNVFLIILTTFSSVFSGYTVIGVPSEAERAGYYAVRWISAILSIAISMLVFFPKIRRLAIVRGYYSPNDFLADRYRSKLLPVLGSLCTCLPQLFYLTVQLVSFSGLLNGLTSGLVPNWVGLIVFAIIVLVLEKVGGMNSVVLSDAIQALLMVFGFIAVFLVVSSKYGSLADLAPADCGAFCYVNTTSREILRAAEDYDTAPSQCRVGTECDGGDGTGCNEYGCIPAVADTFAVGTGSYTASNYFWFLFNFIAFPLNPHMIQRACISKSDTGVRTTMQVLCFASFLTMIPGICVGITVAVFRESWPLASSLSTVNSFAAISNQLKSAGSPILYGLVAMLTCSALAAIMSTADSVILGVSNTLAIDIYKGVIKTDASPPDVVSVGNWISVIFTALALVYGFFFVESSGFGTLLTFQNAIILQIVPAFFLGLYMEDVSLNAVLAGLCIGLSSLPIFIWLVPPISFLPAPNACVFINFIVTAAAQAFLKGTPPSDAENEFDKLSTARFGGQKLTLAKISEYFVNDKLPSPIAVGVISVIFLLSFPGWFWDITDVTLNSYGFPNWTVYVLVVSAIASVGMAGIMFLWQPADDLPTQKVDEDMELVNVGVRNSRGSIM